MRRPTSISTYSISSTASQTTSSTTICHSGARAPPVRRSKTYTFIRPSRARSAWRRPFAHLAGRGVEAAEVAARIVGVPDHVVARDRDAPRARARVRELVLADREGRRIHRGHAVDAELHHEHRALGIHGHAI